ncbi:transferase hexapeptide (six repeat-containing protein) [Mariprofundus aestuarium]|uniref:Transferase hexapeptide (Six repeat-containing protein) n=1 Tax=Mariprofundus aestuarium TaxID=1921086 RepID=A0A2K8L138_MARES|nr:CatB-related O-acetyltransferase [Mariprofundus aestuarium]ATX78634.1 transferase hexapeptide (six repeat-containing protein) [Mariprofundus aestuarium]
MNNIKDLRELYPQYLYGKGSYSFAKVRAREDGATLKVGNFTSIATDVQILLGGEHRPDWVTTSPLGSLWPDVPMHGHPRSKGDVAIGNDVWIGTGALILSGVTIGDGAVVGARAVIAKDVPPYAIVAGNPQQLIKYRFDRRTIERLLTVQWWNWGDEDIRAAAPMLMHNDIEQFLRYAEAKEG